MSSPPLPPGQRRAPLLRRLKEVLRASWDLGFISFGGPPVHFQIFHKRFVERYQWIDEQMYQELFAICQALPGPGSTKFEFCTALIHAGFIPALLAFVIFSFPGAAGMFGLSLGVSNISETLPRPVYALLCGLNSATVGIIALAAVQLSQRAITDKVSRALVFLGATAGMVYNALWYFPLLMVIAGFIAVVWDYRWGHRLVLSSKSFFVQKLRRQGSTRGAAVGDELGGAVLTSSVTSGPSSAFQRANDTISSTNETHGQQLSIRNTSESQDGNETDQEGGGLYTSNRSRVFSLPIAMIVVIGFLISFVAILILRGLLKNPPIGLSLFANLFLAGTIIFGGGPVVIPLLRQYVVDEGWVSSRDFLLGLAIIQAFPGPNFNFAVYLGSLTAINSGSIPSAVGALLAFIAIFSPGMLLVTGALTFWSTLRTRRWVVSILRGINAAAVGLIYTAVYRLWEIGYVDETYSRGSSLGRDPWWVVTTATSYAGTAWFGFPAPVAIALGGVMGMLWYVVVNAGAGRTESVLAPRLMVQDGRGR